MKLSSIFVDFAIFVPYGDRALQDRLFDAMAISGAGVLVKMRLHGPPSYIEWLPCYKIFWTLCIMYNVIDNGFLKRHAEKIHKMTVAYPGSWGLIYQADVRTRQGRAPRVRAGAEAKHAEALVKNWPTCFDPARPWNEVWRVLCAGEKEWWDDLIHRPCNRILSKAAAVDDFLDVDVITVGATAAKKKHKARSSNRSRR